MERIKAHYRSRADKWRAVAMDMPEAKRRACLELAEIFEERARGLELQPSPSNPSQP